MDALEFAEKVSGEALESAQSAYDDMQERVYKFASVLAGGAGGVGAYAIGKLGPQTPVSQVVPLIVLSVYWFSIVAVLLIRGARSTHLMAGTSSAAVRERVAKHKKEGASDEDALWFTRWGHLSAVDAQIKQYADGATRRARALDNAYWCLAVSPAVAALGYLAAVGR
jgi:hypothetical protein